LDSFAALAAEIWAFFSSISLPIFSSSCALMTPASSLSCFLPLAARMAGAAARRR